MNSNQPNRLQEQPLNTELVSQWPYWEKMLANVPHSWEFSSESPLRNTQRFLLDAGRDLVMSREPAYRLFRSQIAYRYRRSSLGLLWAFAPSVLMASVVTLGQKANVSAFTSAGVPGQFYATFGLILLQSFLESFNIQRTLLTTNRQLLFHHRTVMEAAFLAGLADSFFALAVKLPVFACIFLLCNVCPANTILLGFVGIVLILLLGCICGLLAAPWNALKADLNHGIIFLPFLLMGATPIVVQPQANSLISKICQFNPLTWIFDAIRAFSYGHATVHDGIILCSLLVFVLIGLPFSWLLCRIARPYVLERSLI